jgi:hypothetical protein
METALGKSGQIMLIRVAPKNPEGPNENKSAQSPANHFRPPRWIWCTPGGSGIGTPGDSIICETRAQRIKGLLTSYKTGRRTGIEAIVQRSY